MKLKTVISLSFITLALSGAAVLAADTDLSPATLTDYISIASTDDKQSPPGGFVQQDNSINSSIALPQTSGYTNYANISQDGGAPSVRINTGYQSLGVSGSGLNYVQH